ncbi:MAG TPA: flagellin, partial [Peptococcaceae bacterium]|nr:flagellin [Peptococcaceae bacterium]
GDEGGGLILQIGANNGQEMVISIGDMQAEALGINDTSIDTVDDAEEALTSIDNALQEVSAQRSKLGAYQNRLEHTINNLSTAAENLTAAESRIRDVDMAQEMMEFTKNSILLQASQAMLAQANQVPQGVLQLLR